MKLVNISSKIISIGDKVLMPDGEMNCNKKITELPAIEAFIEAGFVRIDNSDEVAVKAKKKSDAEAKAKAKAEAEAKTNK